MIVKFRPGRVSTAQFFQSSGTKRDLHLSILSPQIYENRVVYSEACGQNCKTVAFAEKRNVIDIKAKTNIDLSDK